MNIEKLMDEVGAAGAMTGLGTHPWDEERVTPPAMLISLPSNYRFDSTYGRGLDELDLTITVVVATIAGGRVQRDAIAPYMNGSGPQSIKQALERHTYTSCDVLKVTRAEPARIKIAGTLYLGVIFTAHVAGQGG